MDPSEYQQKILGSEKPVIVDFWAPWCMPCRTTKPILEKLAGEYDGTVAFLPVNADDSPEVVKSLRILGIPTVMAVQDGKEVARVAGAQTEASYRRMFQALAEGTEVETPMAPFDRLLRLGAGALLLVVGISTGAWLAVGIGGLVMLLGIYDRCPLLKAITSMLQRS